MTVGSDKRRTGRQSPCGSRQRNSAAGNMSGELKDLFNNAEEQTDPVEATVKGEIPDWVSGAVLRLGPGKFDLAEDFTLNHWFDGFAILFRFHVKNGKVKFSKKYLHSDAYKKAMKCNRPVFTEFGTKSYPDPCKNVFSRIFSSLVPTDLTDNDQAGLFTMKDAVFATSETCFIRRVDPNTLDTLNKVDLHKLVSVNLASSHPLKEESGDIYNLGCSFISGLKYHIIKIPGGHPNSEEALKKAKLHCSISSSWKTCFSYYHSFAMTEKYLVFVEQPMLVNSVKLLASQVKGSCLKDCFEWTPKEKNKFIIVDKASGKQVKSCKIVSDEPFFFFHTINAYDEDGQIVFDVAALPSGDVLEKFYLNKLRMSEYDGKDPAQANRYVLPIIHNAKDVPENTNLVTVKGTSATATRVADVITVSSEKIAEPGWDMPVVRPDLVGKKYRYVYGSGVYDPGHFHNAVLKVDMETKRSILWRENDYTYPGEPIFVPRPGATDEDDGVLLVTVADVRKDYPDSLVVLNARDMTELGRAEVTVQIPQAIHGIFLGES